MSATPSKPLNPEEFWQQLFERKKHLFAGEFHHTVDLNDEEAFRASLERLIATYQKKRIAAVLERFYPTLEHVKSFAAAIGAAAQAAAPASIVWGSCLAVLECACRYQDTLDSIVDLLSEFNESIPLINSNLALYPYERTLQYPLAEIYSQYIEFCLFVIKHFSRNPIVNLFRSLWSSTPRQRLQKTREAIARQSTNFDAQLLNVERTEAREELMQRQRIAGKNILPKGVAFNHHGNPSFPIHILPARSLQFIKRDTELLRIHHSLKEQDQSSRECQPLPAYCTLLGIGGVGKTETALEYVHTHASAYDLIAWIPAEHSSKRVHAYCQLAKRLGLMREDKVGDESDIEQTREWLETTARPWLLVLDNVEDYKDILSYLPAVTAARGAILLTTQTAEMGPDHLPKIIIEPFNSEDGSSLLLKHTPTDITKGEDDSPDLAAEISDLVGGLPLFIATMGGFIKQSKCTLLECIETFHESSVLFTGRGSSAAWRYEKAPEAVFDIALGKLPPDAHALMNILAFLNPDAIADKLLLCEHEDDSLEFLRPKNKAKFIEMAFDLRDRNLVKRERSSNHEIDFFSVHRSVKQGVLHKLMAKEASAESPPGEEATPKASPIQVPSPDSWAAYEKTVPHILSLQEAAQRAKVGGSVEFARLLSDAGMDMWERGMTNDGLLLLGAAEQVLDKLGCEENLLRADIHIIMGLLIADLGVLQRGEAKMRYQKALHIRQDYQQNTPPSLYTRNNEILLYNAWSDYACAIIDRNGYTAAEIILKTCLEKYREWGPPEQIPYEYAKYHHHMSFCELFHSNFEEAIRLLTESLRLVALATGEHSSIVYRFKSHLACVVLQKGDLLRALEIQTEILEERLARHEMYAYLTLQTYYAVGALNDFLGNLDIAESCMRTALVRARKSHWPELAVARTKFHLAQILGNLGKDQTEATKLKDQARAVLNRTLCEDPLDGVTEEDELALFDHLQPVFDDRFMGRSLFKYYVKE